MRQAIIVVVLVCFSISKGEKDMRSDRRARELWRSTRFWRRALTVVALLSLVLSSQGVAQEPPPAEPGQQAQEEPKPDELPTFKDSIEVGGRSADRTRTDTPVPVDVLPLEQLATESGQLDLGQLLQFVAPSFNSNRQSGSDGSDHIDAATLRGLGPDQVLVLVNGKRRHSSSLVYLFGSRARGNVGTDLNTIPVIAIDRIEILRDGAAAQYGSDAIAGVINIVLRQDQNVDVFISGGGFTAGDGEFGQVAVNAGLPVGRKGTLNLTGEFLTRNQTDRSPEDDPRTIGDAATDNSTFFYNLQLPHGESSTFYGDGGYNKREGLAGAWYRGGIGSDDIPSRNSAEMYPDGFVPDIGTDIEDLSLTLGDSTLLGPWSLDVSSTYGSNRMAFIISNTLNASIATLNEGISPTEFDAGGFTFTQSTTNLDLGRFFPEMMQGIFVAAGLEYRLETYEIFAGTEGSYADYDGPGGGNAGSQGFPGFQPVDEVDADRHSTAAYVDLELHATDKLLLTAALRGEDYSDFGSTTNGKVSLGYHMTKELNLRGSASTGFRAPSLHQRYFSSTFTDFIAGEAADIKLAPNDSELATLVGIPKLKEETSTNYSMGFTWASRNSGEITLDAYLIDIDDRIVLTGGFTSDDPDIGHILQEMQLVEARFFTNAVDTRTKGLDLTFGNRYHTTRGDFALMAALNYNKTEIRNINTAPGLEGKEDVYFSKREQMFVIGAAPEIKATLGGTYYQRRWNAGLRFVYFGEVESGTWSQLDDPSSPNQHYDPRLTTDVHFGFQIADGLEIGVGGTNVFDEMPTEQDPNETENGGVWENVQMGFNGAAYYLRFNYRFSARP
jgi:iron complex outermembrane receptor protein